MSIENIFVKINDTKYPAEINGRLKNSGWDGRDTKAVTVGMDYATAAVLFTDGMAWSIVTVDGETETEYDNSEYSMVGDITAHRDGTVTVLMGKPTEVEQQAAVIKEFETVGAALIREVDAGRQSAVEDAICELDSIINGGENDE